MKVFGDLEKDGEMRLEIGGETFIIQEESGALIIKTLVGDVTIWPRAGNEIVLWTIDSGWRTKIMTCMECGKVIEAGERMYRHNNYTDYVICAECYEDEDETGKEDNNGNEECDK